MKWQLGRRSSNVEDRRGQGIGAKGIGGLGIGGVLVVVVISMLMGKDPTEILGQVAQQQQQGSPAQTQAQAAPVDDESSQFVGAVLGSTEDTWGKVFDASGSEYPAPKLVLFSGAVASACGQATSAVGPFYCPGDQQVYLDTSFFDEMRARLGGGGDFAEAYVIAHEVGHHVQTVNGVSAKIDALRARGGNVEGDNGILVRQELQADCYAGVWANQAQQQNKWMESGDVEEALSTASAIGDDRLQKQSRGTVVPDSFTHGTSEQRVRWFRNGFESGDPTRCDTFTATQL
ncbi:MAG: metallopeptidase [Gammaproteobacteria bacterium RIFCSPHIGHO2_12_FULL_63_22]|nr:MAG: metallopeptidase [Gammaproteobacteria bacterium RIFCSPHIGHO2_12_FULL_63_22]